MKCWELRTAQNTNPDVTFVENIEKKERSSILLERRFRMHTNLLSILDIKKTTLKLKNHKAPDPNNINAELLKTELDIYAEMLHPLHKVIWKCDKIPIE